MTDRQNAEIDSNLASTQTCDLSVIEGHPGYKETKLGWIPEEWEVVRFKKIAIFNPKSDDLPNSFIYIDLESVKNGILQKRNIVKKINAPSRAQRLLKKNDVLFQTVRPYQKNNLFFEEEEDSFVASTGYAQIRAKYNSRFIFHLIHATYFNNQVLARCTGTSFPAISSNDLSKVLIKLPPLPEQQKIAAILSTWDSAIAKQQQLITAKQQFKKGLMQLLLTGEKRFEGFTEKWEMKSLSEISSKIGDGLHSTPQYDENGNYKFINGNNLVDNKIKISENTKSINENEFLKHTRPLCNRTILLSINGTIGNIAFYDKEPVMLGKSAAFINIDKDVSKEYIAFQLQTEDIGNHFKKVATGSTIKNLGLKAINNTKIPLPDFIEQEKIVEILRSSVKEIELLQKQLVLLQGQKRGLMQQLLSGEKRVKI